MNSYEGIILLHGNGPNAVGPANGNPGNEAWNIGWGPRTGTPFILLAEDGEYANGQGNPAAETLLIVTNNNPNKPAPSGNIPGIPGGSDENYYRWGHLECGNLIVHGTTNIASGNSSIKSGQATTDSDGTKTIPFPTGTFTATPIITVTVVDTSNNNQAYTAKIVSATKDNFKVKILSSRHRHQLGYTAGNSENKTLFHATSSNSGTQSDSNYVFMPQTPLRLYRSDESTLAAGLLPSTQAGIAGQDWFTKVEDGANTVGGGVVFNWIATPKTT